MFGYSFEATSTSCVDILRLIYAWEPQCRQPILQVYMLLLLGLSARLRLIRRLSLVVSLVTLKIGLRRSRNASSCQALRLILTTLCYGLLHSFLDP
jgi:hypothetical protein